MYIRIVKGTVCDGQAVDAGAVVDATDKAARTLIAMGKAIEVDPSEREATAEAINIERAVAPRARRRSKK